MKIKNMDLVNVVNFIDDLKAKGLKSIHRTNLSKKLKDAAETFFNNQEMLELDYAMDQNKTELNRELIELAEQTVIIEGGNSEIEIQVLKELVEPLVLEDSEAEFSGAEGLALQVLYYELGLDN